MVQIPLPVLQRFNSELGLKNISPKFHAHYRKRLRYDLDFCHKYRFDSVSKKSLPRFIPKLQEKKQGIPLQKRAQAVIGLYYCLGPFETTPKSSPKSTAADPSEGKELRPENAGWTSVFEKLTAEINLRHYSPPTLKIYSGWTRQFQAFVKSMDHRLLSTADVKGFLTFLAVDRNVSASSQNQAFNALLFLCNHVLQAASGEFMDIPREKRKPFIPVVLSRFVMEGGQSPFVQDLRAAHWSLQFESDG